MNTMLRRSITLIAVLAIVAVFIVIQTQTGEDNLPTWPTSVPAGKIDFKKNVRPLLIINCLECHNSEEAPANGNLNLETRELAMTTGNNPPILVPGKPDESRLITVLTLEGIHQQAMPPTPDKVWGVRREILRRLIEEGADWPGRVQLVHPREIKEWKDKSSRRL